MLGFKKDTVLRYFTNILHKAKKEPINITGRDRINNVIISYEMYQKLLDNYKQTVAEEDIEEYFKIGKDDEVLSKNEIIK